MYTVDPGLTSYNGIKTQPESGYMKHYYTFHKFCKQLYPVLVLHNHYNG